MQVRHCEDANDGVGAVMAHGEDDLVRKRLDEFAPDGDASLREQPWARVRTLRDRVEGRADGVEEAFAEARMAALLVPLGGQRNLLLGVLVELDRKPQRRRASLSRIRARA
jgi:hypothetical protein